MSDSPLLHEAPDPAPRGAALETGSPLALAVPTLSQVDATIFSFRRNVVVAASAGTGKTHRLTALYVLLALGLTSMGQADDRTPAPPITPERIIATTFSRAAALEISLRIEHALADFAAWDGVSSLAFSSVVRDREAALGQALGASEIRRRAGDALARWHSAKIDTLHGVARRIVQRHALAIGLAPGARVLDEEEAQALGDLAVDETLGAALTAGGERCETARWLITSAGGVGGARRQVQRLLDRLDEEGLAPRDLAIADHAAEALALARRLLQVAKAAATGGSPVFQAPAAALARALEPALTPVTKDNAVNGQRVILPDAAIPSLFALLTQRMPARSRRLPADDEVDELIGSLQGKSKLDRAHGLAALLRQTPALGPREARFIDLIEEARARIAGAKRRAGGLGFGDLLRIARDTLRDRPDIARAVRETADVLLVDEFQDTSRVQRDLVYLLREREDAAELRPAGVAPLPQALKGHGLFLVGDRKQSIYGFRGADVAVFSRVCAELCGAPAGRALSMPEEDWPADPIADFVALRESRRSGERILSFVNAFSARDFAEGRSPEAKPRDFEIAYGPAEHLVPAEPGLEAAGGEVVFISDDGSSPEDADPIVRESSGAAREAHVAAAYVAQLIAEAMPLPGHRGAPAQPVRYRDVAILARRRSTIPLIELALGRLSIPYVVAGRALYDAPEVRDVAALLRLLLDPRDRLALATVLRGPMVALSETSLALLSVPGRGLSVPLLGRWSAQPRTGGEDPLPPGVDPAEAIDPSALDPAERARLDVFRARYLDLRRAALRLPPGEAIRAAISAVDLDRILAALPRAEARIGNLDRLVNIARRRGGTLAGFVRWLERRMRDEADEAEAAVFSPEDDAVRLTTIHASKGLDFPVVILLDLNAEPRADHGGIGFIAESARTAPTLVVRHYAPRPAAGQEMTAFQSSGLLEPGVALMPIVTGTLRAAQAEARAREQAERRRLTYVAMTRPRHSLVLVGSAAPPRNNAALCSLAGGIVEGDIGDLITTPLEAQTLLAGARTAPARDASLPPPDGRPPPRPARSPAKLLAIGAPALALFHDCPRRFRMRHLLGIEEPAWVGQLDLFAAAEAPEPIDDLPLPIEADDGEPRARGRAAHRVIQRWPLARWGSPTDPREITARLVAEGLSPDEPETPRIAEAVARFLAGRLARRAREASARVRREHAFVLELPTESRGVRVLALRGAIDLLVEREGGAIDLYDYKLTRARSELSAYEFPLRAYALAVQEENPDAQVRAGVIFLGGSPDPIWLPGTGPDGALTAADHQRFADELKGLAQRFIDARYQDRFEGVPVAACKRLHCGFLEACHGEKKAKD